MHDHHEHHPFPVEEEQPHNSRLFLYGLAIVTTFFTCGIVLTTLFYRTNDLFQVQRGGRPPAELRTLRNAEDQALHAYGWVDQAKGQVRIPIDRAMSLIVEEAQKK